MGAGSAADVERVQRIASFRAALQTFLAGLESTVRAAGLTPRRHLLLLLVKGASDGSERAHFADLADRMKLSRNAVTDLVHRAEADGLLRREPSADDGRVVYLRLTEEGDRRLMRVIAASDDHRRELAAALGDLVALYDEASR